MRAPVLACLVGFVAAACAADPPAAGALASAEPSQCFYAGDVSGFRAPSPRVIYVATARGETIRLDTLNDCNDARNAQGLGFRTPGGERVCRGADVDVLVPGAGLRGRCPVSRLTVLTRDEAAALPNDARP